MPSWEVELTAEDLELLGISNPEAIEERLSELARQRLADLAVDASLYPDAVRLVCRARLKLVVDNTDG